MKKHLCILILVIFSTVICYASSGRGRARIANGTLVTDKGTLLRGCRGGTEAYDSVNHDQLKSIKKYGLNTFHVYVSNDNLPDQNVTLYIDRLVNWTEEDSLYLIITPAEYHDDAEHDKVINFWKYFAPRYKNKTHLIYEVCNEPIISTPKLEADFYKVVCDSAPGVPMLMQVDYGDIDRKATDYWKITLKNIDSLKMQGVDVSKITMSDHGYLHSPLELDSCLIYMKNSGSSIICTEMPAIMNQAFQDFHVDFRNLKIYEKESVSYVLFLNVSDVQKDKNYKDILEDYGISWNPDFGAWPFTFKSDSRTWDASQQIDAVWFDLGGEGSGRGSLDGVESDLWMLSIFWEYQPWFMFKKIDFGNGFDFCNIRITSENSTWGSVQVYLDSLTGKKIGELPVYTGSINNWKTVSFKIEKTQGIHSLFFEVYGACRFEWFYFSKESETAQWLQIPKCDTPPVIDGTLDDIWNYTFASPLLNYQEGVGIGASKSPTDHFSTFRTMWDDNYFYAFVHVMDDTICSVNYGSLENDAIEIYFDAGNEKSPYYDANDIHWVYIYGVKDTTVNPGWRLQGRGDRVWKKTSVGYDFELRIPKESLTFPLVAEDTIGFEITNEDRDNNVQSIANATQWWSTNPNANWDPSVFGTALLINGKITYSTPPAPVLIASANGAIVTSTTLILNWDPSARASAYQLQVATNQGFASGFVVNDSTIIDPVKQIGSLSPNVTYYWRVRAANASGKSDWSETRSFTTRGIPSVSFSKTQIDIGVVAVGKSKDTSFVINNIGTDTLKISNITATNPVWSLSQTVFSIPPGKSVIDTAIFTPNSFVAAFGKLIIISNSSSSPDTIMVVGNSPMPLLSTLKSSLVYGNTAKNITKKDSVKIINSSVNTLVIDSIYTKTSTFTADKINGTVGTDTLKVVVSFTPNVIASYTDTLYLRNNSATSLVKIPLSGSCTTGIDDASNVIPTVYSLAQNFPNPFNPSTTLRYGLPERSTVRLIIYNLLGQVVKELVNTEQQAGYHSVIWNANVSSGIYFYRIDATSLNDPNKRFVETKKILLLR